jgi:hypothetical protein
MDQPLRDPAPVAGQVHLAMRSFVAASSRRRRLPPVLHVGRPGDEVVRVPEAAWYDAAARADLLTRALDGIEVPRPLVWLARGGHLDEPWDCDHAWCAAALTAYARHGLPFEGFFVVTRSGWCELTAGRFHRWHRVRPARYAGE